MIPVTLRPRSSIRNEITSEFFAMKVERFSLKYLFDVRSRAYLVFPPRHLWYEGIYFSCRFITSHVNARHGIEGNNQS